VPEQSRAREQAAGNDATLIIRENSYSTVNAREWTPNESLAIEAKVV